MIVVVPLVRALTPPQAGDVIVSFSVSPAGDAITMWASEQGRASLTGRWENPGGASFPESTPNHPVDVRVVVDSPHGRDRCWHLSITTSFATAHLMPDDHILVVGARSRWSAESPEQNASLYDREGRLVRSACFGDGIEHVVTTATGSIWVGYCDEGVYGNFGWGGPGPEPIGAPGLNRFDRRLELVWSNDQAIDIVDCYAMAGVGEACVLCPYMDFEVSQVDPDGSVMSFDNTFEGSSAMARDGDRLALAGGYGDDRARLVVGRLADGAFHSTGMGRLSLPDGTWAANALVGREGMLHVLAGQAWHAITVRQICSALDGRGRPS
jgi:hypothetical protein